MYEMTDHLFRHEAFFYYDYEEFLAVAVPFIEGGIANGEPIMVATDQIKTEMLKEHVGPRAENVRFVDMAELGRNPARIIPAWHEFVHDHEHQDLTVRGIGEPIWPGRSDAEVVECQHHETLLNVAFDGTPAWWLLCPYDASALGGDVLEAARRSHPFLLERDQRWPSGAYESPDTTWHPFRGELPEPSTPPREIAFAVDDLGSLRAYLSDIAEDAGFSEQRREEFVLAVNELATNSLRHAGGRGVLFVWRDGDTLMCEVRDTGRFEEPLVGRRRPKTDDAGGSGLWIVNQVCDLVQIRSGDEGNVVRVHMQVA